MCVNDLIHILMICSHPQRCLILKSQVNLTLFLFMSLKVENLDLSLTEQREAEININTSCKSVKEMSNYTERQNLFVDNKSWFIRCWMIQKGLFTKNLQKPIIFHYSIHWQHLVPTLRVQKANVDQERLYIG